MHGHDAGSQNFERSGSMRGGSFSRGRGSFERSHGGMGHQSFNHGQGSQGGNQSFNLGQGSQGGYGGGRFANSRQTTEMGGGYQERAMHSMGGQGQQGFQERSMHPIGGQAQQGFQERAIHSMGGQAQQGFQAGQVGIPDSNEEWRKKQEEAIARNSLIKPQETPAKPIVVREVVNIDSDVPIQHGGATIVEPRQEKIPTEIPSIIRHPREEVTPPPSQPRSTVPTQTIPTPIVLAQSVPVLSGAVGGLISSVADASSKSDMEQISEVVGLMAEAFRKLDIFIKSKK